MPGLRVRHDGWTEARTQRFLDTLALTGCVRDAARVAGLSNQAGYRLYKRFPAFAAAWDDALARAQVGLVAIAYKRAVEGKETVIIRGGQEVERRISPSDAMLTMLVKRGDLSSGDGAMTAEARAAMLSAEEYAAGWRFDGWGKKIETNVNGARERMVAKMDLMAARFRAAEIADGKCLRCYQPLPPGQEQFFHEIELEAMGLLPGADADADVDADVRDGD